MEIQISKEALDFVNEHIDELISSGNLNEDTQRVIRLRYGVGGNEPMSFAQMRKVLRWSVAKLRREIIRAEKIVFNAIKKEL